MGRKLTKDMTPEELEAHREYMREYKRRQRANPNHVEKRKPDTRKRDRSAYMREYNKRKRG